MPREGPAKCLPGRRSSAPDLSTAIRRTSRFGPNESNGGQPPKGPEEGAEERNTGDSAGDLATLMDHKLKLGPILARKLDVTSASSGSFSSRSSSTPRDLSSPPASVQQHGSTSSSRHEYTKLPSLLRTLEGRNLGSSPLVGSSYLPQINSAGKETSSPTASKTPNSTHSFDAAKKQVDRDLRAFKADANSMLNRLKVHGVSQGDTSLAEEQEQLIMRVVDIADECLECTIDDFKLTVTDIVDSIEEDRSTVDNRAIKALYTKLLFILTRCSRLLITEQLNLFATEPRNQRYNGQSFTKGSPLQKPLDLLAQGTSEVDESILRSHTMPVKQMADMVKQLHSQSGALQGSEGGEKSERNSRQSKASMASSHKSRLASEVSFVLRGDGTLGIAAAGSQGGWDSERPSPSGLERQFEEADLQDRERQSRHSAISRFSTDATDTTADGEEGSGVPGGILKSTNKKPKGIFKKFTHKLQHAVDSIKKKVAEPAKEGKETPSRSQSFFGAAANFLRGQSTSGSPRESRDRDSDAKERTTPSSTPRASVAGILRPAIVGGSGAKRSSKPHVSPRTPAQAPAQISRSNSSARPSPACIVHRSSSNASGITFKLPAPAETATPAAALTASQHDEPASNSSAKPPRASTMARVRFSVAPSHSSEDETPKHSGPVVRFAGAESPTEGSKGEQPSSSACLPPPAARRIQSMRSSSTRRSFAHRHTSMSGAALQDEEQAGERPGMVRFGSMEFTQGSFDVGALVREAQSTKRARPAPLTSSAPTSKADTTPLGAQAAAAGLQSSSGNNVKLDSDEQMSTSPPSEPSLQQHLATGSAPPAVFGAGYGGVYGPYAACGDPVSDYASTPERLSPEEVMVVCSVCEDHWPSARLEEHSELCAVLQQLSTSGLSVDGMLTTLANVIEEQMEMGELSYYLRPEIAKLVRLARGAAALQPDGSKVPSTRCTSIQHELEEMADPLYGARHLSTITITYARRMVRLAEEKVGLLSFRNFDGGRPGDSTQPMLVDESGASTPRSAQPQQGMTIEEFDIIKPISRGAFGRVYLARKHATGDLFAIKVMKKRDLIRKNMVESVTNERNILAMANNPFVVRFYYSFTSKENLYIVMEYLNGGDCYSLLRKFGALDEDVARLYVAETVLALEYCHAQGIIHRDMKPDNMLISANGHIKLTDFGLSCIGVIDRTDTLGTPAGPGRDEDMTEWSEHGGMSEFDRESTANMDRTSGSQRDSGLSQPSPNTPSPLGTLSPSDRRSPQERHTVHNMVERDSSMEDASQCGSVGAYSRSSLPTNIAQAAADRRISSPGALTALAGLAAVSAGSTAVHSGSNLNPANMAASRDSSQRRLRPNTSTDKGGAGGMVAAAAVAAAAAAGHPIPVPAQPATGRMVVPEHEKKRAVGTPDYLAPELLLGTGHGPEVDWWALGAILYEFIAGIPPFNAETPEEIFDNILDRAITWPDEEDMSPECRDLIDKLLQPNPFKRLGHRGAGEIKMHPWFKGVDWTDLARTKAAFVPMVDDDTDTSYFEKKHVSAKSMAEDLLEDRLEKVRREPRASDGTGIQRGTSGNLQHQNSNPRSSVDPSIRERLERAERGAISGRSSSAGSRMSNTALSSHYSQDLSMAVAGSREDSSSQMSQLQITLAEAVGSVDPGTAGPMAVDGLGPLLLARNRASSIGGSSSTPGSGNITPGGASTGSPLMRKSSSGHVHNLSCLAPEHTSSGGRSRLMERSSSGAHPGGISIAPPMYVVSAVGPPSGAPTLPPLPGSPSLHRLSTLDGNSSVGSTSLNARRASVTILGSSGAMRTSEGGSVHSGSVSAGTGLQSSMQMLTFAGGSSQGGRIMSVATNAAETQPVPEEQRVSTSNSGSSSGLDDLGLPPGVDPFGNFSFTNYQTLSQANVEKLMRLREAFGGSLPSAGGVSGVLNSAVSEVRPGSGSVPVLGTRSSVSGGGIACGAVMPPALVPASGTGGLQLNLGVDRPVSGGFASGSFGPMLPPGSPNTLTPRPSGPGVAPGPMSGSLMSATMLAAQNASSSRNSHSGSFANQVAGMAGPSATSGPLPQLSQLPPPPPVQQGSGQRGSLPMLTANLLQQQVNTLIRQQSTLATQLSLRPQRDSRESSERGGGSTTGWQLQRPGSTGMESGPSSGSFQQVPSSPQGGNGVGGGSSSSQGPPPLSMTAIFTATHPHLYTPSPLNSGGDSGRGSTRPASSGNNSAHQSQAGGG